MRLMYQRLSRLVGIKSVVMKRHSFILRSSVSMIGMKLRGGLLLVGS